MIRPATIYDVPRIQEIINSHAELGRMLFKSLAQLFEDLRDFAVYVACGAEFGADVWTRDGTFVRSFGNGRPPLLRLFPDDLHLLA